MAKQINPVSIPMKSKLSLAEVDDLIHNVEDASFAEKNSITYQGIIRNAHITQDDGYLTTNGKKLIKEQLLDNDGNKIGTKLIDELGKEYKVPHQWLLRKSFQLKNYTGGDIEAAVIYKEKIYILYNDEGLWSLVVADYNTKEVIQLKVLDDIVSATIGSTNGETEIAPTLWILKSQVKQETSAAEEPAEDIYVNTIISAEIGEGWEATVKTFTHTGKPLGHKLTATHRLGRAEGKTVGFEDIDQERRGFFRWNKEHPNTLEFHPFFGTVAPSGIVTGEPIPRVTHQIIWKDSETRPEHPAYYIDVPITHKRLSNGTIAWNIKDALLNGIKNKPTLPEGWITASGGATYDVILGYKPDGEALTSIHRFDTYDTEATEPTKWFSVNVSVNDVAPSDATSAELRAPKDWFITNFADSRGVYYDYGMGWAKCYFRSCKRKENQVEMLCISSIGCTAGYDIWHESVYRSEILHPWVDSTGYHEQEPGQYYPFVEGHLNERVYTVGGTNKGDESILGSIPFAVDLLFPGWDNDPDSEKDRDILKSQVFGLVETSYSFRTTLLTTPSEAESNERDTPVVAFVKDKSLTLFFRGEFYEVIKSSSVEDFWLQKIADYSFKLNVLDNKNMVKEDRDGNISIVKAFIPYNMESFLDVRTLKLKMPPAKTLDNMAKDPNDAWFQGVGYNVNLDVDEPAMSFLLPKIRLPLWISEDDWPAFKNEAIDRRNTILKPVLRGCFNNGEKVDVYYTLQNDSQDCTYKSTQIMINDTKEAKTAKWDKYGKSTYDILKKGMSWWMEEANTVIFPLGIGSQIAGINFITPSAQLPQGYASRLYTNNNRLFLGFNYISQIWHGATIFTIYGSNYYYDGQGIYFVGADQDFTNNNFVTYALGMKFLANSGSEAYFYSDFEKRIYVFTGSNTLQPADLLSSIDGTIIDAVYSSKEQALYMLTSKGRIIVRSQVDICQLPGMNPEGHLEGTTEGAAIIDDYSYKIFSPWEGKDVLPFALRTEHFGSTDYISKLAYVDILLYKNEDENPLITITCQTLNGIEKKSEKVNIKIKPEDWRGNTYKIRFTPKLNIGNAFDIGIYSMNKIGVQSLCMFMEPLTTGKGDAWQNNVVNSTPSVGLTPTPEGTTNVQPSISVF